MKIEFIKEEKINGNVTYFTRVDGCYVDGSVAFNEEEGKMKYEFVVNTKSVKPVETVLESYEG